MGRKKVLSAVHVIARTLIGGAGIVALAYGSYAVGFNFATSSFALLTAVVLLSMLGSYVESITASVVALLCLNFFFAPPIFSFRVDDPEDVLSVVAFLTTSIVVTGLMARVRRAREEELRQTRAELARFARVAVLGELTASIAHEVNQPLAGVVSSGNACQRWLAHQPPNIERASESLGRIIRDANRASEVIARIRGLINKAPPQRMPVNMNEAIREIVLLTRGEVARHRIALATRLAEDLPPVFGDRVQLQQVCLNLIVNAIEAMTGLGDGARDLSIVTERRGADGVAVIVRDTGAGLDAGNVEKVFEAFYTTKREGIGMGLAICRSIIEAHGGRLWAAANQPRGAVFQFTLPEGQEGAA